MCPQWLREFPECGYNLRNSPHLKSAYALDNALYEWSVNLYQKKIPNLTNEINNAHDVDVLVDRMKNEFPLLVILSFTFSFSDAFFTRQYSC